MEYKLINPIVYQHSPIEQILVNRGINYNNIPHYLNTSVNDILPLDKIDNLKKGAQMLISHIARGDKIFVQVDADADGYTSSAVLLNYLYRLFPNFVQNNILYRTHDTKCHGILIDTIPEEVKMVIIPDAGSNQFDEHQLLAERQVDVLVIDHHEADRISQNAVIINNQLCDYENKSLSGVGMVYKFCCYIDELLNTDIANDFLDLVAVGLIADMVDIRPFETHELISEGLNSINNPFLQAMIEKNSFQFKNSITPHKIAFYIAPRINAMTRTGSSQERRLLFEAMLEYKCYNKIPSTKRGCAGQSETILEQAIRTCGNVKNRQTRLRDNAIDIIEEIIKSNHLLNNKILVVQLNPKDAVDKNLTGLIANELMSKYQRPVLILNYIKKDTGIFWEGSGRGYEKSKLGSFREFILATGLVEWAEGHAQAFGCSISNDNINKFILSTNYMLANFDFQPLWNVDFIYHFNQINPTDIISIASYEELWGQQIDEPLIAIENIRIGKNNIQRLGEKKDTIKITLPNGIELIKFKSSEEEYQLLYSDLGCVIINVVGVCSINTWAGETTAQILIEDFEIIKQEKYYF